MVVDQTASFDAILNDQIYIGNLSAGQARELHAQLGITHIISVCTEGRSESPNHLVIPVQDSEYADLLIHLPDACRFIQTALDGGGKVLIHCVMGISRSAAVVCAYLMATQHLTATSALKFVRQRRPEVHPNYGFVRQLQAFAECSYNPSSTNTAYISWKRRHKMDVTNYLTKLSDTIPIIRNKLFVTSDFPRSSEQAESLLLDLGITHYISVSPAQSCPEAIASIEHHSINIPEGRDALLLALPDACLRIHDAINSGQVLVHCLVEARACIVVCSYLMFSQNISVTAALKTLEQVIPLFSATQNLVHHLELFKACEYAPTSEHPLVMEWVAELDSTQSAASVTSAAARILDQSYGQERLDVAGFSETVAHLQKKAAVKC